MFPTTKGKKPEDPDEFVRGAGDYGHARLAKKMIDEKMGAMKPHAEPDADDMGGPSDMDADNMPGGLSGEEMAEGEGLVPMELAPDEVALIEKLRAAKSGGSMSPPPDME